MKKLCLILALLIVQSPVFAANNLALEAENLVQLICNISQYTRIQGTISNVETSEKYKVISLNFGQNFNTSLSAIIYNDIIPAFASAGIEDPAEYFKNKTVMLEGIIRISNGKPEIIIDSPSQIKIIDKNENSK